MINNIEKNLKKFRQKNPLTHCITNYVTVNDCANAVLAIGGSPFMAEDHDEVCEVVTIADALVINIGTLTKPQIESMKIAAKKANETNTPLILDPVGVGVTEIRTETTLNIINECDISVIRGNISEIKAIANLTGVIEKSNAAKGVDVNIDDVITKDNLKANGEIIKQTAKELKTTIVATGPIDILSDGEKVIFIDNGDEIMSKITGSGCMLSAIVGSCVGGINPLEGSLLGVLSLDIAGEKARAKIDKNNEGTGSFRAYLIDYLYKMTGEMLVNEANIEIL